MGAIYSRINRPLRSCSGSVTEIIRGRKRKHEEVETDSGDEMDSSIRKSLNTPVKYGIFRFFTFRNIFIHNKILDANFISFVFAEKNC